MSDEENIEEQPTEESPLSTEENKTFEQPLTDNDQPTKNMEVHKHPHHVTHKKKWGEYLLEFLMIFLAVTAGFFAENFREHLSNNSKEKEYMHSLLLDLESDTAIINKCINYNIRVYKNDSTLLNLLNHPANDISIQSELFKDFSEASNFWVDFNEPKTFEQLKSTGDYRLIKNKIVLDSMSKYYQQVSRDNIFRNEIQSQLQLTYNLADKIFDAYAFENNLNHQTTFIAADLQLIREYSNKLNHLLNSYKEFVLHMEMLKQKANNLSLIIKKEYHLKNE